MRKRLAFAEPTPPGGDGECGMQQSCSGTGGEHVTVVVPEGLPPAGPERLRGAIHYKDGRTLYMHYPRGAVAGDEFLVEVPPAPATVCIRRLPNGEIHPDDVKW